MILPDFKDFPRVGRILSIDWGLKRVGVAVSTPEQTFVFAHPQIANSNSLRAIKDIIKVIESENIVGIVLGLPLRTNGTESDTTKMVRSFADNLAGQTKLPICFIDESLSSFEAEENLGHTKNKKEKLDSESARVILENAIAIMKRS